MPPESSAIDLRQLVAHAASIPSTTLVEAAQAEFARTKLDFLAVLAGDRLLGICARREISQALGFRFGFALNARQVVTEHLMPAPLAVTIGTSVTEVFKRVADRSAQEFYDDVLLVDERGGYVGLIPMRRVVQLQTQLLLGNIETLEASRQEIAAKNRQMEEDLQMAREVQLAMLPQTNAPIAGAELSLYLAHQFQPAGGVSGDFFDVLHLADDVIGVLICDVMGHGVRSALITAMVRAMLEELRPVGRDPGLLLTRLNRDLTRILRQTGNLIFVTAAYVVFDLGARRLRYAQAGHPTALRSDPRFGTMRPIDCPAETAGPALGLIDDFEFLATDESLAANDRVVLFTDGTFEAATPEGEEFGPERLADALARQRAQPLDQALTAIVDEVAAFTRGNGFSDDVCIVAVDIVAARHACAGQFGLAPAALTHS